MHRKLISVAKKLDKAHAGQSKTLKRMAKMKKKGCK
jgi:hypothetical protein